MSVLAGLALLLGTLVASAYTPLSPQEATPGELRRQPLSGDLLQPGEHPL